MSGPVVLVVLDGFGIGDGGAADATVLAQTPFSLARVPPTPRRNSRRLENSWACRRARWEIPKSAI